MSTISVGGTTSGTHQDDTDNHRVLRDNAFEEGVVLKLPRTLIPRKIADNFSQIQTAFARMQKQCIRVVAVAADPVADAVVAGAAVPVVAGAAVPVAAGAAVPVVAAAADKKKGTTDTTDKVLQAYRWKAMLIKTTLLSALNGICFELKSAGSLQFYIRHYAVTGPEYNRADPERLVLQNFVFLAQNSKPTWYTNGTQEITWNHYRRTNMTHVFRLRTLLAVPAGVNVQTVDVEYDLTKFVFGVFVAGHNLKYMWHLPLEGNEKYSASGRKVKQTLANEEYYSSRIDSSEALVENTIHTPQRKSIKRETNFEWYRYLCDVEPPT